MASGEPVTTFCPPEGKVSGTSGRTDGMGTAGGTGSFFISLIVQPGTFIRITTDADATGIWYVEQTLLGPAIAAGSCMINGYISQSRAGGAETVAIKTLAGLDPSTQDPVFFIFRSATPESGAYLLRVLTSALSLTIPSTATMGFSNSVSGRIWWTALDNAGTIELAAINCRNGTNIFPLQGWGIISTTIMDTSSDSAAVMYSAAARSSVAYIPLGYSTWESGLATVGTWDTASTRIQLAGYGVPLPGMVVRTIFQRSGTVASSPNTYTISSTSPTTANGFSIISQAITPTSAANLISIQGQWLGSSSTTSICCGAFLYDGTSLLAVNAAHVGAGSGVQGAFTVPVSTQVIAGSTSSITYSLYGFANAGTTTINGDAGSTQWFGTLADTFIKLEETMA